MNRREFTGLLAAAGFAHTLRAQDPAPNWGNPVIDLHHHWRTPVELNTAHMDGAGITKALLLTEAPADAQAAAMPKDRFARFTSVNVARADRFDQNIEALRQAARTGSLGFGEMKSQSVQVDGPEMRRVFGLANELALPVLIHFQEVTQQTSVGTFNLGLTRLPALLKEYPKITFIGHADFFWANVSTEVPTDQAYPTGPVKRGGLTDRMLSDHENLWGDLAAYSGRNFLARDEEFSRDFLKRHQNKLMFGSDCFCRDGRGTGQTNPFPLLAGKCTARETLTALKQLTTPDVFKKLTWDNATKLLKLA
jgi:predicted TIM-barrel fold metal-dependent hydrolase